MLSLWIIGKTYLIFWFSRTRVKFKRRIWNMKNSRNSIWFQFTPTILPVFFPLTFFKMYLVTFLASKYYNKYYATIFNHKHFKKRDNYFTDSGIFCWLPIVTPRIYFPFFFLSLSSGNLNNRIWLLVWLWQLYAEQITIVENLI